MYILHLRLFLHLHGVIFFAPSYWNMLCTQITVGLIIIKIIKSHQITILLIKLKVVNINVLNHIIKHINSYTRILLTSTLVVRKKKN